MYKPFLWCKFNVVCKGMKLNPVVGTVRALTPDGGGVEHWCFTPSQDVFTSIEATIQG